MSGIEHMHVFRQPRLRVAYLPHPPASGNGPPRFATWTVAKAWKPTPVELAAAESRELESLAEEPAVLLCVGGTGEGQVYSTSDQDILKRRGS